MNDYIGFVNALREVLGLAPIPWHGPTTHKPVQWWPDPWEPSELRITPKTKRI